MVKRESSRVTAMKHTYKLVKEGEDDFIIEDLESDNRTYWSLKKLIEFEPILMDNSFRRTRKWVLKNHPELML